MEAKFQCVSIPKQENTFPWNNGAYFPLALLVKRMFHPLPKAMHLPFHSVRNGLLPTWGTVIAVVYPASFFQFGKSWFV